MTNWNLWSESRWDICLQNGDITSNMAFGEPKDHAERGMVVIRWLFFQVGRCESLRERSGDVCGQLEAGGWSYADSSLLLLGRVQVGTIAPCMANVLLPRHEAREVLHERP